MTMPKYILKNELTPDKLLEDFDSILYDNYFIFQYSIRKFITDKNILFDGTLEENKELIKIYGKDKMTYLDFRTEYKKLFDLLFDQLFNPSGFKIFDFEKEKNFNPRTEIIDFLVDTIIVDLINKAQYFINFYNDEVFKGDQHVVITDILLPDVLKLSETDLTKLRTFFKNQKIKNIMLLLNYISMRYGIMITSLYSNNFKISNCNESIPFNDLISFNLFISFKEHKKSKKEDNYQQMTLKNFIPSYDRISLLLNEKMSSNNSKTSRDLQLLSENLIEVIKNIKQNDKIKKSNYKAVKKEMNDFYSLSRSDSNLRRAGLLIWDILHNPDPLFEKIRKENSITNPTQAGNYIVSQGFYTNTSNETPRMLNKHYNNVISCIKESTIVPIS